VEDEDEPVPVGQITVYGNVPSFTVYYKESDDQEPTPITKEGSDEPEVN